MPVRLKSNELKNCWSLSNEEVQTSVPAHVHVFTEDAEAATEVSSETMNVLKNFENI